MANQNRETRHSSIKSADCALSEFRGCPLQADVNRAECVCDVPEELTPAAPSATGSRLTFVSFMNRPLQLSLVDHRRLHVKTPLGVHIRFNRFTVEGVSDGVKVRGTGWHSFNLELCFSSLEKALSLRKELVQHLELCCMLRLSFSAEN